jgi:hypothetical protein
MKYVVVLVALIFSTRSFSQDTTVIIDEHRFTLSEVVVRNNFNYKTLLTQIKEDTTFYKAFRNLRILGFSSYNDIQMKDKNGAVKASLFSKTRQNHAEGCRTMDVLEEKVFGDFYDKSKDYNYMTAGLYAGLFFTKGKVCGENNIVKGRTMSFSDKSGMEKHKEQLKMLFFNPGKKIPGIPLIGNKLDLYDDAAHKLYDYKLDVVEFHGAPAYVFSITPKDEKVNSDRVVIDQMVTWFDMKTLEVLARNYSLSYKAGLYDFDVSMEVEMTKFEGLTVPKILRYRGDWDAIFKKRERGIFTATLFDFKR